MSLCYVPFWCAHKLCSALARFLSSHDNERSASRPERRQEARRPRSTEKKNKNKVAEAHAKARERKELRDEAITCDTFPDNACRNRRQGTSVPAPALPQATRAGRDGCREGRSGVTSVASGNGSSACSGPWAGPWAGGAAAEAALLLALAALGMGTNCLLMGQVAARRRGWAQGLLFHQGLVDCTRAGLLLPLGLALLLCQRAPPRCPVLESAFLLLVTVSTVNLLTWVLSDGGPDSPQCLALALFLVWFASVTVQLGPTFLAGARAAHLCPVQPGPHYVLGLLWVSVNALCVLLTAMHLRRLHRDLCRSKVEAARVASLVTAMMVSAPGDRTMQDYVERQERWGLRRLRAFGLLLAAYMLFWGPLFVVTLVQPKATLAHQVAMHVAFVHATVNPALLLVLDTDPRGSPGATPLQLPVDQMVPLPLSSESAPSANHSYQ